MPHRTPESHRSNDEVIERIDAVARGDQLPWTEIAEIMEDVEAGEVWRQLGARSFTNWVEAVAPRWRLSSGVLWRYRTVWKTLPRLLDALEDAGVKAPDHVGRLLDPDSVDLLGKISAVVGGTKFADLASRALSGRSSRSELRRVWAHLKDADERSNAVAGVLRAESVDEQALASELVHNLLAGGLRWIGDDVQLIRMVRGATMPRQASYAVGPHVTLVCRSPGVLEAVLHYVHYGTVMNRNASRRLGRYAAFYDACWLVARDPEAAGPRPPGFGLLGLTSAGIAVADEAQAGVPGARSGETARILLAMLD